MKRYLLLLSAGLIIGCQNTKDDTDLPGPNDYEIVFYRVGGDCRLPLIEFVNKKQEVEQLVGPSLGYYYGQNLPGTLPAGTTLYVTIRRVKADESRACTTMGPGYNAVFVTGYRIK